MKTFRTATAAAAALLALALVGPAHAADGSDPEGEVPGRSDDGGHPVVMSTSEQDCWEHNTIRTTDWQSIADRLPAGWEPSQKRVPTTGAFAGRPVSNTVFVDFTCESWSIDGLPPRRTTVSWLAAYAKKTDGSAPPRVWSLHHSSDNPLFVERLRKLGVSSTHLTDVTTTITTREDGGADYRQEFHDRNGVHEYVREGSAPPLGPGRTSTATFWFDGDRGPVSITYDNTITGSSSPATTERFGDSTLRPVYGFSDVTAARAANALFFLRGSWTGTLRLQPTAP